jgi:hypothetical protein
LAVCDAARRFTYYVSQVPTTHDSLAWSMSTLGQRINNGELPAPFFINGDAAFTNVDRKGKAATQPESPFLSRRERSLLVCS